MIPKAVKTALVFGLTLISVLCVLLDNGKAMTFRQQEQKYIADNDKANYIDLPRAGYYCNSWVPVHIRYMGDRQMEVSWERKPGVFYLQIFDNLFDVPPGPDSRQMAAIPSGAESVRVEFNAIGRYRDYLDVILSQYDDNKRIDYQTYQVKMPFSLSYYKGRQLAPLYSFDYKIRPDAKYFKIQIRVYGYFKDNQIYLGYMDMNWE